MILVKISIDFHCLSCHPKGTGHGNGPRKEKQCCKPIARLSHPSFDIFFLNYLRGNQTIFVGLLLVESGGSSSGDFFLGLILFVSLYGFVLFYFCLWLESFDKWFLEFFPSLWFFQFGNFFYCFWRFDLRISTYYGVQWERFFSEGTKKFFKFLFCRLRFSFSLSPRRLLTPERCHSSTNIP